MSVRLGLAARSALIFLGCSRPFAKCKHIWYFWGMSQDRLIRLKSTKSEHIRWSSKNKKLVTRKIEMLKFDPTIRERVIYKEAKK